MSQGRLRVEIVAASLMHGQSFAAVDAALFRYVLAARVPSLAFRPVLHAARRSWDAAPIASRTGRRCGRW